MKPITNMTNTKATQSKVDAIVEIIHMLNQANKLNQVGCLNTMNITVNDNSDNVHVSFSKYDSDREYEGFVFNKHIHSNYNFLTYKGITHRFTKCEMILLNSLISTCCERSKQTTLNN